jgi:cell division protein WhiA
MLPGGKVSKSAVNHRLRKLDEIANQLRRHTEG